MPVPAEPVRSSFILVGLSAIGLILFYFNFSKKQTTEWKPRDPVSGLLLHSNSTYNYAAEENKNRENFVKQSFLLRFHPILKRKK